MLSTRLACIAAFAALAGGCGVLREEKTYRAPGAVIVEEPVKSDAWTQVATAEDEARIDRAGLAWQSALADARRAGFGNEIRKEGLLLEPRAALPRPAPTPGSYNCRLIRLGRTTTRAPAYESFKPFFCYVEVERDLLTIVKQTGSERPAGRLWRTTGPSG